MKDNYPLNPMEKILYTVIKVDFFSFIDDFSRYNQIWVKDEDRFKKTFTTKWGTFAFQ